MTTAAPSTALATIQPAFTDPERLALAGFLAGYRGLTREAYALDLRQFTAWCRARSLPLFAVRRADIESFAPELEARGRARATVTRRLCTIAGLYKYAVEEELLEHSPAANIRRPRVDYESHAVALDHNELGALLVAAGSARRPSMDAGVPMRDLQEAASHADPRTTMRSDSAKAGPRQPGPVRDLHRCRLRRGCRPVNQQGLATLPPGGYDRQAAVHGRN
jgi:Phage integrase, N-terminal SAM-like domain